jgi:hypothetical protein
MKKLFYNKVSFLLLCCFIVSGCTDPYKLQTNTFEEALVVEATITNEYKKHEIKISKTYRFEDNGPTFESDADVYITDNAGNQFEFEEQSGVYVSTTEFQAIPGMEYQLNITTSDGKSYTSTNETLTAVNEIESLIPTVTTKNGERGVQINVNSYDPNGNSRYYRYDYEETYKIIAPKYISNKAVVLGPQEIGMEPRTTEARTCYSTKKSTDIILSSTNGFNEDRVNYPMRFISNQNYIISHRYSILVRQYIQNLASYTFYKTLKELSGSESILSQNQPGFFYGNLKSLENPNEKVIGFFEVSSVSSKRIFFNYADLFPGEALPPYYTDCTDQISKFCFNYQGDPECAGDTIIGNITLNTLLFYYLDGAYYHMVPTPCGDCTSFSSNIIPSFWIN